MNDEEKKKMMEHNKKVEEKRLEKLLKVKNKEPRKRHKSKN